MLLAHRIQLVPTPAQRDYFVRAAGTARRVWNWALAEWQRQLSLGHCPDAMALKKQFNAIKFTTRLCRNDQTVVIEDLNAAIHLQWLATGAFAAHSALPVASPAVMPGTAADMGSAAGGKVTPVRYEYGQQDGSGQEKNDAHL